MKFSGIDSAAPEYRGCKNNVVWLNLQPEGELEIALMRTLAGHQGKVVIYKNGNAAIEFKPLRRKNS
jgi:hypothetical protein